MSWSSWSSCLWVFWATWIVGLRFIAPLIIDNEFDISLDLSVKALNLYAHFICDINFSQNISIFLRPIQKSETIHFIPLFTLLILIASTAKRLGPSTATLLSQQDKSMRVKLNGGRESKEKWTSSWMSLYGKPSNWWETNAKFSLQGDLSGEIVFWCGESDKLIGRC